MSEEIHDECGVAAVFLKNGENASKYLYKMLLNLQERGQLSAGMTTYDKSRPQIIDTYRNLGTVNEVFKTSTNGNPGKIFDKYSGDRGIGHVRYATSGSDDKSYAQPFERHHGKKWKWFSFGFNGNLVNYPELKKQLVGSQYHLVRDTDTELIMHYISKGMATDQKPELPELFSGLTSQFDGAYNITFMNADGDIVILRDPLGIRPMVYGQNDEMFLAASESNALINCRMPNFSDLHPGQMIVANDSGVEVKKYATCPRKAHCMFEWVYFANVSSVIDGRSVYIARANLGKELAKMEPEEVNEDYIVVGIPDTSKPIADALAYELGIPAREGLIRNRHVGRVFIDGKKIREDKIRNKFTILREILKDKKVILVDDSLVRGLTSRNTIHFIKNEGGAAEVHMRIACPPITSPCFYGIDMSTIGELTAPKYMEDPGADITLTESQKIAEYIGADSLVYQTKAGLVRSIGLPQSDLCMACLNRDYPTQCGRQLYEKAQENHRNGIEKRSYE
jgi:amidophosphoribosyltransferase